VPPIPAETFNVNARDLDWVNRQCTMQPLATFQRPLHLTGGLARIKTWKTLTMSCGHDVMLDLPEELTQELLADSPLSTL